jgi:hypothetical protein
VFIASRLADDQLLVLTTALAAQAPDAVLLIDTPALTAANKSFLELYRPDRVIPVGAFPDGVADLETRLDIRAAPVVAWQQGQPAALWRRLIPRAERVVVCPAQPRPLLLQAACLAGVLQAPLVVLTDPAGERDMLGRQLGAWHARTVFAAGASGTEVTAPPRMHIISLPDAAAVADMYLHHQLGHGPVRSLVVANPADVRGTGAAMSPLAPWVALQRRAALLLTNEAGTDVRRVVDAAIANRALCRADALVLVADLKAIPMEKRPNPVAGKDAEIEMEPLTPTGTEPFSFATGRLFHTERGVVALMLARQRLLVPRAGERTALVVSNPTGGLPLLEAFSRNTVKEMLNRGYQTTALVGKDVNKEDLRRLLPDQDIFLWEGHYNTMVKEYGLHEWTEPLRPSLVFLQSCLALSESKAQPFLERGALGVIGSSTRTFSGSGGACALAFFDALLYENRSLGGSLRQAKNFLLAYSLLKEKRLGDDARLGGANLRSAWAFTLWGDPTLELPRPPLPDDALAPVRHRVEGNTIVVALPDTAHERATSARYKAQMLPNARLAGLISKEIEDGKQRLVPFLFAEVHLPRAASGQTPHLHSRLPSSHWVFCWDARRSCGYLLIIPRAKDREELRFHVDWEDSSTLEARTVRDPSFRMLESARAARGGPMPP